ncbi:hypothetical protein Mal65_10900 [Crateriforma conspicua]|nr:hypothetical protein Mal65_10900 [Crateriforma conspicua]
MKSGLLLLCIFVSLPSVAFGQCRFSCGPGERPSGSCCRTWYYDQDGNRICTGYGTYCVPDNWGCGVPVQDCDVVCQQRSSCSPCAVTTVPVQSCPGISDVCGPNEYPCGQYCCGWYYDENGNRICTRYCTRCCYDPTSSACGPGEYPSRQYCETDVSVCGKKKYCTPWTGTEADPCIRFRDCRYCKKDPITGLPYSCGSSFSEQKRVCLTTVR